MMTATGLFGHVGNIWKMMCRANCEDGILSDCTKSRSLQDLSQEVMEEMEGDHLHILIRDAYLFGNNLVVINKVGKRIVVGFDDIAALRSIPIHDRDCFKIEENGSCLYWWTKDIHLDFESFLYYVDDEFRAKAGKQKANHDREFGKAIAIVRTTYKIPIDGIAGLKAEDAQDIESGYLYPTSIPLTCYAKSLGLSLDSFLEKVATNVDVLKAMEAIKS
jgi:hypothetical protein